MLVGVPTEVKVHEYRVALTPAGVNTLIAAGHDVVIQSGAGLGSAITDEDFEEAGARIAATAAEVWESADLLCKVKEPAPEEFVYLRPGLIVFAYLHLAADLATTQALLESGATSFAYETVRSAEGALPLLAPMSEIAGRLATQIGAVQLLKPMGGPGILMGGVPGTAASSAARRPPACRPPSEFWWFPAPPACSAAAGCWAGAWPAWFCPRRVAQS